MAHVLGSLCTSDTHKTDKKFVTLISLLDLDAVFDTLDHSILLRRLEVSFGIKGNVLAWFTSYVSGCFQSVSVTVLICLTHVPFSTESHRALYLGQLCSRYILNHSLVLLMSTIVPFTSMLMVPRYHNQVRMRMLVPS